MLIASYFCLLAFVVLQRLLEVRVSKQNERALRARGAREHAAEQMPYMVALHSAWLLACALEVGLLDRAFRPWLGFSALFVFCLGQALRLLAMHTLGERWTVKVITLPGAPAIDGGIFRYLRHPNYLGVVLEIAALPLVHGAWLTALLFSAANGLMLWKRIGAEEHALNESGNYKARLHARPRFIPRFGRTARRDV